MLAHSIKLRNPYVDPMHLIQVDMLRRKRAGEDTPEVNRAIAATISGISAGLQKHGLRPALQTETPHRILVSLRRLYSRRNRASREFATNFRLPIPRLSGLPYVYASMSLTPSW